MIPDRDYTKMNEAEIRAADTSKWIAVLPLGAHEQHGPHLPFETDTIIAEGIACRLAGAVDDDFPVTFLPAEPLGYSIEHMNIEGSRTLTFEQAVNRWIGIGEDLSNLGIGKLLLLNAHGGNSPLTTIVSTELRSRCAMLCVATAWTRFIVPGDIISSREKAYGIHGGDIETSVMMTLAPEMVEEVSCFNFQNFQEELSTKAKHLRAYGHHAFGWMMSDLNPRGVAGDASAASASKGEALILQSVTGLKELLDDMADFDRSHFER